MITFRDVPEYHFTLDDDAIAMLGYRDALWHPGIRAGVYGLFCKVQHINI